MNDEEKSNSEKFQRVTWKLREALDIQKNEHIIWENVFHASFEKQLNENSSAADDIQETETASSKDNREWKRMKIQSIQTNSSKKKTLKCSACDMSEHSLAKCWYIFEELKSQKMKLYNHHIQKIKKIVKNDEQLKKKIEKICEKIKKKTKSEKKIKNVRFENQE